MFLFVLLSIIMFFFCLYLYIDNKKLKQRITQLELEFKEIIKGNPVHNKEKENKLETEQIKVETLPIPELNKPPIITTSSSSTKDAISNKLLKEKDISMTTSLAFDPNEFIRKSRKMLPQINIQSSSSNCSYLEEISKHLKKEIQPQTIGLTEYEKNQEEQAIISYQELLSLKENRNNQTKYTDNFIEELKDLRNLLD